MLAPFYGRVARSDVPSGGRTVFMDATITPPCLFSRGSNATSGCGTFDLRLWRSSLGKRNRGNPAAWRRQSWFYQLRQAIDEIKKAVPQGASFILVDDGSWGQDAYAAIGALPFPEEDGIYMGHPADGEAAVTRSSIVFSTPAWSSCVWRPPQDWWLDFYGELRSFLDQAFELVSESHAMRIFRYGKERPA